MVSKRVIEENNRHQIMRQLDFRMAADAIVRAFVKFPEVSAIALTGSVAKMLWKEVPRFHPFHRAGSEIWHECLDVDLAVWVESTDRLGELRRAKNIALTGMVSATGGGVASHQAEIFLFEPKTNKYLGRLCQYSACPKGKPDCMVPGCGEVSFLKIVEGFKIWPDLLETARISILYERGAGIIASALNLPQPGENVAAGFRDGD